MLIVETSFIAGRVIWSGHLRLMNRLPWCVKHVNNRLETEFQNCDAHTVIHSRIVMLYILSMVMLCTLVTNVAS